MSLILEHIGNQFLEFTATSDFRKIKHPTKITQPVSFDMKAAKQNEANTPRFLNKSRKPTGLYFHW